MKKIITVLAGLALPLLGIVPASAASPPPAPGGQAATLACQITNPDCTEPVAAVGFPSFDNYVPAADAALTSTGGVTWLDPDNAEGNGTQDWTFARIATVPPPGGGPGAFNFTGFDRHNYGLDGVYEAEFTPFGQDTGRCLHVTLRNHVVLRTCNGGPRDAWIIHFGGLPFVNPPGHPGYVYALSVVQSLNAQHHRCLTGHLFSGTTASRCVDRDVNATDTQRWSALP